MTSHQAGETAGAALVVLVAVCLSARFVLRGIRGDKTSRRCADIAIGLGLQTLLQPVVVTDRVKALASDVEELEQRLQAGVAAGGPTAGP